MVEGLGTGEFQKQTKNKGKTIMLEGLTINKTKKPYGGGGKKNKNNYLRVSTPKNLGKQSNNYGLTINKTRNTRGTHKKT